MVDNQILEEAGEPFKYKRGLSQPWKELCQ